MTTKTEVFESGHEEMVHDAQMDYYGKRLATASSDRTVRIFDTKEGEEPVLTATLKGHDGPVWQVGWAHPKYGNVLASCSYDGKVCVWKEEQMNQWGKIHEQNVSAQASVNSIAWGPYQAGLVLAAGSSDGRVVILTMRDDCKWSVEYFLAHNGGCNAVSWGPISSPIAQQQTGGPLRQLVTGGCDNTIKIWSYDAAGQWQEQKNFEQQDNRHGEWVRDVQWAPSLGLFHSVIASCSEDKSVIIWSQNEEGVWKKQEEIKFDYKVWRVSWSPMGNILAVSQGDNKVSLWKEAVDGKWQNLSSISEDSANKQ